MFIDTPTRLKLIDTYLVFVMLSGILQFVYCVLVGTYPYNAFLAGFSSCVGAFVLAGKFQLNIKYRFQLHHND
jgi:oligosaccharyltransferase complex subunit epsilon